MTKDEALNAWKAALDTYLSVHRNSPELVSWRECFSHWWRARSAKPEEDTQTITTGDGIPYEYKEDTKYKIYSLDDPIPGSESSWWDFLRRSPKDTKG